MIFSYTPSKQTTMNAEHDPLTPQDYARIIADQTRPPHPDLKALKRRLRLSRKTHDANCVLSFDLHPADVLRPDKSKLFVGGYSVRDYDLMPITWLVPYEKAAWLTADEVDYIRTHKRGNRYEVWIHRNSPLLPAPQIAGLLPAGEPVRKPITFIPVPAMRDTLPMPPGSEPRRLDACHCGASVELKTRQTTSYSSMSAYDKAVCASCGRSFSPGTKQFTAAKMKVWNAKASVSHA